MNRRSAKSTTCAAWRMLSDRTHYAPALAFAAAVRASLAGRRRAGIRPLAAQLPVFELRLRRGVDHPGGLCDDDGRPGAPASARNLQPESDAGRAPEKVAAAGFVAGVRPPSERHSTKSASLLSPI